MMKKILLSIIALMAISLSLNAQNVNIPDANFKAYLVGNPLIDTNGDQEIQFTEASAFSGTINCSYLSISNLTGIEAFTALTELYCNNNQLTSLDISNNTDLTFLRCENNQLTSLDISNNTDLTILRFDDNQLTSLDISNNTDLTYLNCNNNQLTSLNVANGNNPNFTQFFATNNPNLTCIQVDNVAYSTTNWTNIDPASSFSTNCSGLVCTVNIPDANFKAYLVGNTAINTNGDTEIQCSEASAFTGTINCFNLSITDLSGIEAFTDLKILLCNSNPLSSLDVSSNTALETLNCSFNSLSSLDVSSNTALSILNCSDNSLSSLDVSSNTALTRLFCSDNSLSSLDVSSNTALTNLLCYNNSLSSLDVANGNNTSMYNSTFDASSNSNLTCIQVDDATYSTTNWTNIDPASSFSTNCGGLVCTVNIPDANFKAYLVGNTAINTNGDTEIQCSEASAYTGVINCPNLSISDLSGIEGFVAITELNCSYNSLSNLDISSNINLLKLYCGTNSISSLDVSNNTSLTHLHCNSNLLSSIDISNNTTLTKLNCDLNSISSLDVSNNTSLTDLSCSNNLLNSLVVSNNTNLVSFSCTDNLLSNLDVSNNTSIITFKCSNNALSSLDLSNLTSLSFISCHHNSLTSLNVANGNNINVTSFIATDNPNLTCVQVDDAAWSNTNWANPPFEFDATASFSTNCASSPVLVNSITVQGQGGVSIITTNGGTLQMVASVLPANADDPTYTWSISNGTGTAALMGNGVIIATGNGTVTVIATANDGSGVTGSATITISNQGAQPVLVNSIAVEGENGVSTITTNGGTLQMEATVLPMNADDATYTWTVARISGDAIIDASGLLTATADGTVNVTATSNDGSNITGTKMITITNQTVGINDLSFKNISVYPNPTNGIVNLNVSEKLTTIKLIDLTGKTIKEFNTEERQLNISEFSSGIYFLEIANAENKSIIKLIKQ